MRRTGRVWLVGAGPGDPGLMTVKGRSALERAEVVVYDHLVSDRLLDQAPATARRVYVGKEHGRRVMEQSAINRLMIREARAGRAVVRLKGGDPVLFGRGGEEALALVGARIPFEIVPGVTSALAVPAYAGIPITHRGVASSVAIITGRAGADPAESIHHWDRLATAADTLVCLMGITTLTETARQLMRHGRSPRTPCAVIQWGTTARQRTVTASLGTIAEAVTHAGIRPPAIIVVGEVVRLRRRLRWFDAKPLFGLRVLVTRPAERASALSSLVESMGAEAVELPAIRLVPVRARRPFRKAVAELAQTDWVFFTSPEGIDWFARLLQPMRRDLRVLQGRHIGAIGPKTAAAIRARGIHVDFTPSTYSQEGLLHGLRRRRLAGRRALIFCAAGSRDALERGLRGRGMTVRRVAMYDTVSPPSLRTRVRQIWTAPAPRRRATPVDVVTVTSASTVAHLARAMRACGLGAEFGRLAFASIGPVTSQAVRRHGGRVAVEASTSTIEGLVEAMGRSGPRAAVRAVR